MAKKVTIGDKSTEDINLEQRTRRGLGARTDSVIAGQSFPTESCSQAPRLHVTVR
ncbi:MAG: hypothetical protein WA324_20650 [Bryobacteraceae bacterium]